MANWNTIEAPEELATVQDLRAIAEQARSKALRLEEAHQQLAKYSDDLRQLLLEEQAKSQLLVDAFHDSLIRLTRACAFRDHETGEHVQRLGHYATLIGKHLRWPEDQLDLLGKAAPMHDLGKIAIPDAILTKTGPLSAEEWKIMESHTTIGAQLLDGSESPLMEMAREVALTHHERWDGTGYPARLKGEAIPKCGRIVMLADQYDALRSKRSYKPAFSHVETFRILMKGDGRTEPCHFDPLILECFGDLHKEFRRIFDERTTEAVKYVS